MSRDADQADFDARLSRIATSWSMVAEAHASGEDVAASSRQALFERYAAASYQYLLGAVRDPDVAEELLGELAVRFFRGDFHRATPKRGRFRDYIRKTLINLANDYCRSQRDQPRSLPDGAQIAAPEELKSTERSFEDCLREELLDRTWQSLAEANATYHAVLQMRVFEPDLSSREIAEALNRRIGKNLSADTIRKTLERARTKFAALVLEQVACLCESNDAEGLRAELRQLDLLKYCQSALANWRPDRQSGLPDSI